jgi:hypothetical protein
MVFIMAKKKSKAAPKFTASMFKITGGHAKMSIDSKKRKLYYFSPGVTSEKAEKAALKEAPDILGAGGDIRVGKPSLKYDFYCAYDASLDLKFLRLRTQELGVNEQVQGAYVGNEVVMPKKGKNIPGKALHLDIVELFEIKRTDGMILDGKTGSPAAAMEKLLKGTGKKTATAAWIKKISISPGKFNTLDKVARAVSKPAGTRPSDAKRVVGHALTFKKLEGYYVPMYYLTISLGEKSQKVRINGINGDLSLVV